MSLNYRLANPILFLTDKKVQLTTVLQLMADLKAALRFFVKDAKNNKKQDRKTTKSSKSSKVWHQVIWLIWKKHERLTPFVAKYFMDHIKLHLSN